MDIFLAILVLFAILLLGVLISIGNERQRKAIDGIREQAESWAEQDIVIKREKLARQINIGEPAAWLEKTAAATLGAAVKVATVTPWRKNGLTALVCLCQDGRRLVFSPAQRKAFLDAASVKSKGALASAESGPLGDKLKRIPSYDLSVVTSGMFFDIEAGQVWQSLTGEHLPAPRLTMYEVPAYGRNQ